MRKWLGVSGILALLLTGCGQDSGSGERLPSTGKGTTATAGESAATTVLVRKIDDAIARAEAALRKEFGHEAIAAQRPFTAVIINNRYWLVTGTPVKGKVAEVQLRITGGGIISAKMLAENSAAGQNLPKNQVAPYEAIRPGEYE